MYTYTYVHMYICTCKPERHSTNNKGKQDNTDWRQILLGRQKVGLIYKYPQKKRLETQNHKEGRGRGRGSEKEKMTSFMKMGSLRLVGSLKL